MINTAILMGRLCNDPELKQSNGGTGYTKFRIAVDRDFTPKGAERQTDFINCTAFGKKAEFINKYFKKGSMIAVQARFQSDTYEVNGEKRNSYSFIIDNVSFCGEKSSATQSAPAAPAQYGTSAPAPASAPAPQPQPADGFENWDEFDDFSQGVPF